MLMMKILMFLKLTVCHVIIYVVVGVVFRYTWLLAQFGSDFMFFELCLVFFFFFKQKTAYEMRISDWSSDVCSSDLFGLFTLDSANLFEHMNDTMRRMLELDSQGDSVAENGAPIRWTDYFEAQVWAEIAHSTELGEEVEIRQIGRASCRARVGQYV